MAKHRAEKETLSFAWKQRKLRLQNRYYAFWLPALRQLRKGK